MPEDDPSSVNHRINNYFTGFIDLINIQIKIVVNDITCCSNQNRSQQQQNKAFKMMGIFYKNTRVNTILKQQLCKRYENEIRPPH